MRAPAPTRFARFPSLPFASMRGMGDAARMLDPAGPRCFPIDAAKVVGPLVASTELTLAPGSL